MLTAMTFQILINNNYVMLFTKHENSNGIKVMKLSTFIPKNRMSKGSKAITYYKKNVGTVIDLKIVKDNFKLILNNGKIKDYKISDFNIVDKLNKPEDTNILLLK